MKQRCKMLMVILLSFFILMIFASFSLADESSIKCTFTFPEEYAQVGKVFTFSYALSGGSGSYRDINVEAEFVTVHDYCGNDVDNQVFEIGSLSSGTVSFTPIAGTAAVLFLRGYDAETDEYFYFECHEGYLFVQPNPQISISFRFEQEQAAIGQKLSCQYNIAGTSSITDTKAWWQIGGEMMTTSMRLDETNISLLNGQASIVPLYGEYIYYIIMGKDKNGLPFYAESEHLILNNEGTEKITCKCSFPEHNPQIGIPYSFSFTLSGGSGSFSDINVEVECVTVYDNIGNDVDIQIIELGSVSSGNVTFVPRAGKEIILWLRGKDKETQQSFYFECHQGRLFVDASPKYPVVFSFNQEEYQAGDTIKVSYDIKNLSQLNNGKLYWVIVSDYDFKVGLNVLNIDNTKGEATITPMYGECIYAILQGEDAEGNPIYAESEQLQLGVVLDENLNIFVLPSSLQNIGDDAFRGTSVQKVVMPPDLTISNIAFTAFVDTPLKVIVGSSEDAKTYALEHGVLYESIE